MSKNEKPMYSLSDIRNALVEVDQNLAQNPHLQVEIVNARRRGFAEQQIPQWRSEMILPDHIGVVFDQLSTRMNGGQEPLFSSLTLWKAEEHVFGIEHDEAAFNRRQDLLRKFYPSAQEASESA